MTTHRLILATCTSVAAWLGWVIDIARGDFR